MFPPDLPYAHGFDKDPCLAINSGDLVEITKRGDRVNLKVLSVRCEVILMNLVTGGAGFIGSSLCETLIKEGHKVVALDSLFAAVKLTLKQ